MSKSAGLLLLTFTACAAREAGPTEAEFGSFFFWRVGESRMEIAGCTNANSWLDDISPVGFEEDSFFVYRLADNGKTATAQVCETFAARTCTPVRGFVFNRNKHTFILNFPDELRSLRNTDCELNIAQTWTMVDAGQAASLRLASAYSLVGEPSQCDPIEALIVADAPNGLGIDGCSIDSRIELRFSFTRTL